MQNHQKIHSLNLHFSPRKTANDTFWQSGFARFQFTNNGLLE